MGFPLIKMADEENSQGSNLDIIRAFHELLISSETSPEEAVAYALGYDDSSISTKKRKENLEYIYNTYTSISDELESAGIDKSEVESNIALLQDAILRAEHDIEEEELAEGKSEEASAPSSPDNKQAPKKGGKGKPHQPMVILQQKIMEYLAKNPIKGLAQVTANGFQGDKATWDATKAIGGKEWWNGNTPKFRSYEQITSWVDEKLKSTQSAPAKQEGVDYSGVLHAWNALLRADPNFGVRGANSFTATSANIKEKMKSYIDQAKIPMKESVEAALASLEAGSVDSAIQHLNRAKADAEKQKHWNDKWNS